MRGIHVCLLFQALIGSLKSPGRTYNLDVDVEQCFRNSQKLVITITSLPDNHMMRGRQQNHTHSPVTQVFSLTLPDWTSSMCFLPDAPVAPVSALTYSLFILMKYGFICPLIKLLSLIRWERRSNRLFLARVNSHNCHCSRKTQTHTFTRLGQSTRLI